MTTTGLNGPYRLAYDDINRKRYLARRAWRLRTRA